MKSIIQTEKECYICGSTLNLHLHHIFEGNGRRKISDKNGFTCWLCYYHHNGSDNGVHFNKSYELLLKRECQTKFEETHSREEFIRKVGRNYLDDDSNKPTERV